MKKSLRLTALLLCLLMLLSACGSKPVDEDSAPAERHTAQRSETPSPAEAPLPVVTEEPQPYTEPPVSTPAPAVRVEMRREDGSDGEKVFFFGLAEDGTLVWQHDYTTDYRTELTLIEEIGAWQDRFYFNLAGTVVCLRIADGEALWANEGFGGASISCLIDKRNGNVYLCGWYGPDFYACDCEGRTLANFRTVAEGFYWPSAMSWNGPDELVIYYHGGAGEDISSPYYVDLTDFSISYDFGYVDLDADSQYWANIFISDFAEQFKYDFPTDGGSDFELASFAHLFCKINRHDAIRYDGNYDSFSLDTVNELCMRFFGREIHPSDGVLYENQWGLQWTYENGTFRFPSGDGEAYNRFAVVDAYLALSGGTVILSYSVYELDLDEYWKSGMDGALYRLTSAEAGAMAATGRITRVGRGTAEVLPIEQNGHDGYYLYWMRTDLY